jgi:phosphate starvation-inducible PhoH-like protein
LSTKRPASGGGRETAGAEPLGEGEFSRFFGHHDQLLRHLEKTFGVEIRTQGSGYAAAGPPSGIDALKRLLGSLQALARAGFPLEAGEIKFAARLLKDDPGADVEGLFRESVKVSGKKPYVFPKSIHQRDYLRSIREHDIVFGIGPAGTGKTYLAMAMAVAALLQKEVGRIILTRPAVEAGEKLGFLPGDVSQKIHPYLIPLYDALYDMISPEKVARLIAQDIIEIAPLAYMRGRTLNDSFIILDEAQNTTSEQMKMFLTRMGFNAKAVVTGDITQIDLPTGRTSGLVEVGTILRGIKGISFTDFDDTDVVRHELVQKIILAYERAAGRAGKKGSGG